MNLEEAKIKLQELVEIGTNLYSDDVWQEAVTIVLAELEKLQKSEEDLMKNAGKMACKMSLEIDRLQEENKYMVGRIASLEEDLEYYTNSEEIEE